MPWPPKVDTAATVARLRDDPRGLDDLPRFRHLKKWTTELFAASWGTSHDTATAISDTATSWASSAASRARRERRRGATTAAGR